MVLAVHPVADGRETSGGNDWLLTYNPGSDLYKRYVANPLRCNTSITWAEYSDSEIPQAGDSRYIIRLGGRWGLVRYHPSDQPDTGFQLDLEGGFLGFFDLDSSMDNIGWDGIYGFYLSWSNGKKIAAKIGLKHVSSHVGDEYAEKTGRRRVNYTREEYLAGVRLSGFDFFRIYGESGYGYNHRDNSLQDSWRISSGIEFEYPDFLMNGRVGYYAASDFTWYQESNWKTDITVQSGLVAHSKTMFRTYRIGVEYRDGRSLIGEFFNQRETYFGFGLWGDF
jgi:hypothetical protein